MKLKQSDILSFEVYFQYAAFNVDHTKYMFTNLFNFISVFRTHIKRDEFSNVFI